MLVPSSLPVLILSEAPSLRRVSLLTERVAVFSWKVQVLPAAMRVWVEPDLAKVPALLVSVKVGPKDWLATEARVQVLPSELSAAERSRWKLPWNSALPGPEMALVEVPVRAKESRPELASARVPEATVVLPV